MIDRMIRAAKLDSTAYEEVEADQDATAQAAIIVVLTAIAAGIAFIDEGIVALLLGIVAGLIGWVVYATAVYFVGTRLFADEDTSADVGELLRTLGFAQTPRFLLVLGFIPVIGLIISLVVAIWLILTTVVAIRQALDFSTLRAVGTAIVAVIVLVVVQIIFALLFGGF